MTISCSLVRLNDDDADGAILSLSLETSAVWILLLLGVLLLLLLLLLLLPVVARMGGTVLLVLLSTEAASVRVGSVLHARLSQIDRNNKIRNFDRQLLLRSRPKWVLHPVDVTEFEGCW